MLTKNYGIPFSQWSVEDQLVEESKRPAELYVMTRKGCGPTHYKAFIAGAKFMLNLIKSGKYSINKIIQL